MKHFILIFLAFLFFNACGDKNNAEKVNNKKTEKKKDSFKGIGEIKNVRLNNPLDESMILQGSDIYDMKCAACHKLTDRRVVGPGFLGVTERRKPEWIMNMITNVDVMLDKDPTARKLFEECLTRMPNQNVSTGDARNVLEFLIKNDSKEVVK